MPAIKGKREVKCDNCPWEGPREHLRHQLMDIHKLWTRIDVGGEVPAGVCDKCGALAYIKRPDVRDLALDACQKLINAYKAGLANGGSVDWDDVDLAHAAAQKALRAEKADKKKVADAQQD